MSFAGSRPWTTLATCYGRVRYREGVNLNVGEKLARVTAGNGCELLSDHGYSIKDELAEEARLILRRTFDVSNWHVVKLRFPEQQREEGLRRRTDLRGMSIHRGGPAAFSSKKSVQSRHFFNPPKEAGFDASNLRQNSAPLEDVYHFAQGAFVAKDDFSTGRVINAADTCPRCAGSGEIGVYERHKVVGQHKRLTRATTRDTGSKWGDLR